MPPRLLLVLVLLAAAAALWFVLGDGALSSRGIEEAPSDLEDEPEDPALRTARDPGLAADGRARPPSVGDADRGKRATAPTIGDPRPERVTVPLRGVIRGRDGRPVAGAHVTVFGPDGEPIELTTDASGRFTFEGRPGRYRVRVDGGPDGVLWIADALLSGGSDALPLEAQLATPGRVTVRVVAATGPVDDVTVALSPDPEDATMAGLPAEEGRADATGVAAFTSVIPGRYLARTTTGEGTTYRVAVIVLPAQLTEARLLLLPTRPVKGSVTREDTGAGIGDARVRILIQVRGSQDPVEQVFRADFGGAFAGPVPRGIPQRIEVEATGFAPTLRVGRALPVSFLRAFTASGDAPAPLDMSLSVGRSLHGIARDGSGAPLEGIGFALDRRTGEPLGVATTAADGSFAFDHVPGGSARVRVTTHGFQLRSTNTFVTVPADRDVGIDLTLVAGKRIQGRVIGRDAKPVAGARVWIQDPANNDPWAPLATQDPDQRLLAEAFTDDRGWWRIENVPTRRRWDVRAAHGALASEAMSFNPTDGIPQSVTLVLHGTGSMSGTVKDAATDAPIPGATVVVLEGAGGTGTARSTTTNADGTYEVRGLSPGLWRAYARAPEHLVSDTSMATVVREGTPSVDLLLERGLAFEGTVVDEDGTPLEGARVSVEWRLMRTQPAHQGTPSVSTDAAGRFRLQGFPPGRYAVHATIPGTPGRASQMVTDDPSKLRLVLPRPKEAK